MGCGRPCGAWSAPASSTSIEASNPHPKTGGSSSALGIEAAVGEAAEPRDPEGYLRRLDRQVPALDPAVRVYVAESVQAFAARCYLSSSAMLRVAAERAFLGLAEALATTMEEQANKLRRDLNNPCSSQRTRFDELRKMLDSYRKDFPEQLVDTLTLDAVGDLLRVVATSPATRRASSSTRTPPALTPDCNELPAEDE